MAKKIYNRFGRTYKGLDCSGPNKVLPPTFEGIRALVDKVGEPAAFVAFSSSPVDEDVPIEKQVFEDFLADYNLASDKVERLTLLDEFRHYLSDVEESLQNPTPPAAPAKEGAPTQPKNDKEGEPNEPPAK